METSRASEPTLSFAEFTERVTLSTLMRGAFEMYLRTEGKTFDYRTEGSWRQLLSAFQQQDRRRRYT